MDRRLAVLAAVFAQAAVILIVPLVVLPRAAAAAVVGVDVLVRDVHGKPIRGVPWHTTSTSDGATLIDTFRSGSQGRGTFRAYRDADVELEMFSGLRGGTYPQGRGHVRFVGGRLSTGDAEAVLTYAIHGSRPSITVTLPALETHTLRVLTRGDRRPVANVGVSTEGSVSVPLSGPAVETRIVYYNSISSGTNFSGRARITTYATERDQDTAARFVGLPDDDGDGEYEGAYYDWSPLGDGRYSGRGVDYSVWASQSVTRVTLGIVPMVDRAHAEPGRQKGTVRVTARVVQWWGQNVRRFPKAGVKAYLVKPSSSSGHPRRLASDRSDDRGRVVFDGVSLRKRTRLVITLDTTNVPSRVLASPSQ